MGTSSGTPTVSWTASYTPTMSMTGTRSYTPSATITPTMTILNAQAVQNSQSAPSSSIATVGIISGAAVASIFGIVLLVFILRRPIRTPATRVIFDEQVPVVKNPGLERQRSMSFPPPVPPPVEVDMVPRPMKNPFAPKGISVRFNPIPVRNTMTSFNLPPPPPPPPPEEEV
jgi:hypothetical protein